MTARSVVFDIGNVLIPWDIEFLYAKLIVDPRERREFLDSVVTADFNARLDAGESLDQALGELIARYPQHEKLIRAFDERWIETLGAPIEGSVRLLRELRSLGVPVYALTNFGAGTWPRAQDTYPFLSEFDGVLVSGFERVCKPDPAIFALFTDRFCLRPDELFFTDDSPVNVAAARSAGWRSSVFTGPDALRRDLLAAGLPLDPR